MSVPTCDHLKEDGVFCNSPALHGRKYCYFHLNLRGRRLKAARARRRGDNPALNLPFPEDMHAVQVSLAEILWALAERRIDRRDAATMLYALQQASTNLNQTPRWNGEREAVPGNRPLRALNLPDLEKRFGLPDDVDLDNGLDADPEAAPPPTNLPQSVILSEERSDESKHPQRVILSEERSDESKHPQRVILSEEVAVATDESKDPFVSPEISAPADSVATKACPPAATSPDRVPLPEAEVAALQLTLAEELEFFSHCMQYGILGDEDKVKMNWVRAKRAGLLSLTEEDRERHAAYELMAERSLARKRDAA